MSKSMTEQQIFVAIMDEVSAFYRKMQTVRPLSESELAYFYREFSISASYNSNAIEGNKFTLDETRILIEKGIVPGAHSLRESEDIIGYKEAFDYLYRAVKGRQPISEEFVKKIHGFVLRGDSEAGRYRTIQNYVGSLSRVVYTPCPPKEVPQQMKAYQEEVEADLRELLQEKEKGGFDWMKLLHMLSKHHICFENIHPFIDGNGRTGRLLLSYEMIVLGLLPIDIRYEEQERYYAAIQHYRDKEQYSTRPESKTEKLAKLIAECELQSMRTWLAMFA